MGFFPLSAGLQPPSWQPFTPATQGVTAEVVDDARFLQVGKLVLVVYAVSGVSNAAAKSFTLPLPTTAQGAAVVAPAVVKNNGMVLPQAGLVALRPSSQTCDVFRTFARLGFAASGAWSTHCTFSYETP